MDLSIFGCGNKLSVYLSSTNPQYTRLNKVHQQLYPKQYEHNRILVSTSKLHKLAQDIYITRCGYERYNITIHTKNTMEQ